MEKKEFTAVPEEVKSRIHTTIDLTFDEILLFRTIPDSLREVSEILKSHGEVVPSGALVAIANFIDNLREKK